MIRLILLSVVLVSAAFGTYEDKSGYLFVMLRPISACNGKCNNYELKQYPFKSAEACQIQEDSCKAQYGDKASYYTVAPGEAVIFYKYNQFVTNCDCKILGVHKSSSVASAKEEMQAKVDSVRVKKPKAYHNYEVTSSWPK